MRPWSPLSVVSEHILPVLQRDAGAAPGPPAWTRDAEARQARNGCLLFLRDHLAVVPAALRSRIARCRVWVQTHDGAWLRANEVLASPLKSRSFASIFASLFLLPAHNDYP